MTSERKRKANKANAQASTGPKFQNGKMRSAQNARRHGLSVPALSDPTWLPEVQNLARKISGDDASDHLHQLALNVAGAQIDLMRVRQARQDLIARRFADPNFESAIEARKRATVNELMEQLPEEDERKSSMMPERLVGADKLATVMEELRQQLFRMQRYERRALSRRKFAIRAFDLAARKAPGSVRTST